MLGNVRLLIGQLSRPVRTANQHRCNLTQNERHQPSGVEAEWTDNQVQKTSLSGPADIGTSISTATYPHPHLLLQLATNSTPTHTQSLLL